MDFIFIFAGGFCLPLSQIFKFKFFPILTFFTSTFICLEIYSFKAIIAFFVFLYEGALVNSLLKLIVCTFSSAIFILWVYFLPFYIFFILNSFFSESNCCNKLLNCSSVIFSFI